MNFLPLDAARAHPNNALSGMMFMMDSRIEQINAHDGFNQLNGIKIIDWQEGKGSVQLELGTQHTNPAGLVHGGALMGMLDVVLALTGSYDAPPLALMPGLTLSLNTEFIAAAHIEDGMLVGTATKTGGGRNIFFSDGEIRTTDNRLIARASGVFKKGRQPHPSSA